jgi:filamentous hemagglutinin
LASPSGIAPKLAYQFAQSYPTAAGGVAGGIIGGRLGALAGPEGAAAGVLIGGGLGAAALSAAQTLGPVYAAELQKNPNDPEGAWSRAWRQAEITGAFSGAAWAAFPARFFQSPVKQLVLQMFGVQPGLAVGQRVTSNIVEGRPATEGLGEAYGQGVLGTAIPALGHGAVGPFLPRRVRIRRPDIDVPAAGPSPAEQLRARRAAQLKTNSAAGRAWEDTTDGGLDRNEFDVARQLTLELPSGTQVRHDFVTRNRVTGQIGCIECKSSATAPVKPNQTKAFREMEEHESTVVGRGKPAFPPGMKIPPTKVEIRRPRK